MNSNNEWNVLPEKFLERLPQFVPPEKLSEVLNSFCIDKPITFRANTLKISADDLAKELQKRGIGYQKVSWYDDAFVLDKDLKKEILTESELVKDGMIYIQNLSSMIPALVLNPDASDLVLDLAAAPGSKTTQLAGFMKNNGEIIANDKSRPRLYRMQTILQNQGVTNTKMICLDGKNLWRKYPQYFTKTLIDVPCTMEGRFHCSDPDSYKDWTNKKVRLLSQLQKFLLRSAVSATQEGGVIVYATCTLEPEENEEVIDWLLKKEGKNVIIEDIDFVVEGMQDGLTQWHKKIFDPQLKKTKRILPSTTMEGFYVAKIKKVNSTLPTDW